MRSTVLRTTIFRCGSVQRLEQGFKNSIESASLLGETTISIPTTAGVINLPLNDAKIMLAKIQRYADACYLVTMQHKQEVAKLTNITDVEAYDITKGYPDKLTF
jgi:hypothetical protein